MVHRHLLRVGADEEACLNGRQTVDCCCSGSGLFMRQLSLFFGGANDAAALANADRSNYKLDPSGTRKKFIGLSPQIYVL